MAGLSKRFTNAGYNKPKYMLELNGISLFKHSLLTFSNYFKSDFFLFVLKSSPDSNDFIRHELNELGISNFEIIYLEKDTLGQAETVYEGLIRTSHKAINEITIFNIDTFRLNFEKPIEKMKVTDGYLEVFTGEGLNWSYIKVDENDNNKVVKTTEKEPISNLCCTGLYYFKYAEDFIAAYKYYRDNEIFVNGEIYVAPLFNYLIKMDKYITFNLINVKDVIFCGTPNEYESLIIKYKSDK